jgi:Tfp pilus assembly protein PilF
MEPANRIPPGPGRGKAGLKPGILIAALALCFSCSMDSMPKLERSPIGEMALAAPEGYANRSAAARNQDGIDHLLREHWRKAEADFNRALEADPEFAAARFNLALSLDRQGKHEEAGREFRRAAELDPGNPRMSENPILKSYIN